MPRLVQFRMTQAEYRNVEAMAKRAELSVASFIRTALMTHAAVEKEMITRAAAEKAATMAALELRLLENARRANPDSFVHDATSGKLVDQTTSQNEAA
jgi:mobilization protein NikA